MKLPYESGEDCILAWMEIEQALLIILKSPIATGSTTVVCEYSLQHTYQIKNHHLKSFLLKAFAKSLFSPNASNPPLYAVLFNTKHILNYTY